MIKLIFITIIVAGLTLWFFKNNKKKAAKIEDTMDKLGKKIKEKIK